jgi:CRP/FNR family transcriptional regulator
MTFSTIFTDRISRIYAISEEKSDVLLLPVPQFLNWLQVYPQLNQIFFMEYDSRYRFMMETINKIVFQKLDHRVLEFLQERIRRTGTDVVKVSHKKIADELGTAREVVSRILKKFEKEGLIIQSPAGIGICEKR